MAHINISIYTHIKRSHEYEGMSDEELKDQYEFFIEEDEDE